ncbi:MAG: UDP-N-acetylmuramoyl-tripeptide--D-alanyl-D-alanine ligase [Candidatus Omnitrophica bacterium]|nr:UDP-N-acetylmuramoyl-tripeptide--D-alanyl-D-alanine ligase [Candidatus Omnitrophota bacterium]
MFTIDELIKATQGRLVQGPAKGSVRSACIDSRLIKKDQLFIAIKGDIFDGHDFITDVVAKGVRVLLVHKPVAMTNPGVSVIAVHDTTRALGHLARFHRLRFKVPVIALTGSAGKTTTKEMITGVLNKKYRVLKNEGTQNNHIGVPMTLLRLRPSHEIVVLECGTNQPGDIAWLADITRPTVVLFTNIGESHLEKLKNKQGVLREKWNLTKFMDRKGAVIFNQDDPLLRKTVERFDGRLIAFSLHNKIKQKLPFRFSSSNRCSNALAAYVCGRLFHVPHIDIYKTLDSFKFPSGREEVIHLKDRWLINDTYNANPVSMRSAIEMLNDFATPHQRIMVAADMLELGSQSRKLHESIGSVIAQSKINVLITVGHLARHMALQVKKEARQLLVFTYNDIESAAKELIKIFVPGDVVLIKGSRDMRMERLVEHLKHSNHSN